MGHRLSGNLLLQEQRFPCQQAPQDSPASGIPQRWYLPLHLPLPRRVLLPPRTLSILGILHRPNSQHRLLSLPAPHHRLFGGIGHS